MTFQFLCPQGHLLQGEEAHMGMECQCPQCGTAFIIPTIEQPAPAAVEDLLAPEEPAPARQAPRRQPPPGEPPVRKQPAQEQAVKEIETPDDDPLTDANVFAVDLILVVKSGSANRCATEIDRRNNCDWSASAGSSHLNDNIFNRRGLLTRRVSKCHHSARTSGTSTCLIDFD